MIGSIFIENEFVHGSKLWIELRIVYLTLLEISVDFVARLT